MKIFIPLVSLIVISACSENKSSTYQYDFTPIDSIILGWIDEGFYPGAAMCVVKDSSIIFEKSYGCVTDSTPIYVASAGKWVAAATIAAAVEHSLLEWDDTVAQWLPEFVSDSKGTISLTQLLSHTSGVRPYLPIPDVDNYNQLDSAVAAILPLDTVFTPGKRFEYGGLAGRMAEKAMSMKYEQIFQTLIATPLSMSNSHFTPINTDGGHAPMLAGGLRTTLSDYMHFLEMISGNGNYRGNKVLSTENVAYMQTDHVRKAQIPEGEYVSRGVGKSHNGIYGLGVWRELIDENGEAYQISSPGWAGAYPWINKRENVYVFFIAHVTGSMDRPEKGFNSFFGSPILSSTVSTIINK